MKIGGVDPTTLPTEVFLVLPRGDEQEIVIRARPVSEHGRVRGPLPAAGPAGKDDPRRLGAAWTNDPTYQQVLAEWGQQRLGYMVVKSLEPSQIEWDTVEFGRPAARGRTGPRTSAAAA